MVYSYQKNIIEAYGLSELEEEKLATDIVDGGQHSLVSRRLFQMLAFSLAPWHPSLYNSLYMSSTLM